MAFDKMIEDGFYGSGAMKGNGYCFRCPVVERDAAFVICAARRHKHWRGERTQATDCHVAMNGSKCPALVMMSMEWAAGEPLFYDSEVTTHPLPRVVAERIEKVILSPYFALGYDLTPEQQELLFGGVRETVKVSDAAPKPVRKRAAKIEASGSVDLTDAIGDTDMANTLNQAMGI